MTYYYFDKNKFNNKELSIISIGASELPENHTIRKNRLGYLLVTDDTPPTLYERYKVNTITDTLTIIADSSDEDGLPTTTNKSYEFIPMIISSNLVKVIYTDSLISQSLNLYDLIYNLGIPKLSVPVEFSYSTDEGANIEFMYVNSTEINVKRLAIILRTYSQIKLATRKDDSVDTMGKFLNTMSEIIGSGWNNITK
jgi:hypothetical protein